MGGKEEKRMAYGLAVLMLTLTWLINATWPGAGIVQTFYGASAVKSVTRNYHASSLNDIRPCLAHTGFCEVLLSLKS